MQTSVKRYLNNMPLLYFVSALLIGAAVGLLTIFGQGTLPGHWNSLANSGAVWVIPAFFVASAADRKWMAMAAAALSLLGMVFGYYYFHSLLQQYDFVVSYYVIVWLVCALIGGVIFGFAGYLWGHREDRFHEAGTAFLSGVFLAEALSKLLNIEHYLHMIPVPIAQVVIGLLLILLMERTTKERLRAFVFLIPILILGLIGFSILGSFTN